MRTPTLALVAAAALSSSLVNGAPASYNSQVFTVSKSNTPPDNSSASANPAVANPFHPKIGIMQIRDAVPDHAPSKHTGYKIGPREPALDTLPARRQVVSAVNELNKTPIAPRDLPTQNELKHTKRVDDNGTLGGNAFTGNSGNVDGGGVVNAADNYGMPTLFNMNSNNAGMGGKSIGGCALGGHGNDRGSGGNAYSGTPGSAQGGSVWNSGAVTNIDSTGAAGTSQTGCATGGDVADQPPKVNA